MENNGDEMTQLDEPSESHRENDSLAAKNLNIDDLEIHSHSRTGQHQLVSPSTLHSHRHPSPVPSAPSHTPHRIPVSISTHSLDSTSRRISIGHLVSPQPIHHHSSPRSPHPYASPTPRSAPLDMSPQRRGSSPMPASVPVHPSAPQMVAYNNSSLTSGLKVSPRRRRAPAFPATQRHPKHNQEDGRPYSPTYYLETPSILRVPRSPLSYGQPQPIPRQHPPSSARDHPYNSAPVSNVRGGERGGRSPGPSSMKSPGPSGQAGQLRATARLEGIPHAYVMKGLHGLAEHFWNKTSTADCRILIPVRRDGQTTPFPTGSFLHHAQSQTPTGSTNPSPVLGHPAVPPNPLLTPQTPKQGTFTDQQASTATNNQAKILTFPLHRDYLTTQSTLFKELLETPTRSPLDTTPGRFPDPKTPSLGGPSEPPKTLKGARVLPTPLGIPTTLWVPIPDPSSFGVLAHWLYWGDATALESALGKGHVTWQGIVKNIDYLGLDDEIKRVMGIWWRRWVKVSAGREGEVVAGTEGKTGSDETVEKKPRRAGKGKQGEVDLMMDSEEDEDGAGAWADDEGDARTDEAAGETMDVDGAEEESMTGLLSAL